VSWGVEYLYSVVVSVGYDVLTNLVDGDSSQAVKLTLTITIATETEPVDPILRENLDPVIGGVGHDNGVVRSHSDPPGPSEQPGLRPAGPKGKQ